MLLDGRAACTLFVTGNPFLSPTAIPVILNLFVDAANLFYFGDLLVVCGGCYFFESPKNGHENSQPTTFPNLVFPQLHTLKKAEK